MVVEHTSAFLEGLGLSPEQAEAVPIAQKALCGPAVELASKLFPMDPAPPAPKDGTGGAASVAPSEAADLIACVLAIQPGYLTATLEKKTDPIHSTLIGIDEVTQSIFENLPTPLEWERNIYMHMARSKYELLLIESAKKAVDWLGIRPNEPSSGSDTLWLFFLLGRLFDIASPPADLVNAVDGNTREASDRSERFFKELHTILATTHLGGRPLVDKGTTCTAGKIVEIILAKFANATPPLNSPLNGPLRNAAQNFQVFDPRRHRRNYEQVNRVARLFEESLRKERIDR